jgi:hypothetical protein
MGTIAAVQPADQLLWPSSPWRVLQVMSLTAVDVSFFVSAVIVAG